MLSERGLWAPYKLSIVWLAGTYALFLLLGEAHDVTNLGQLTAFVASTLVCFTVGYRMSIGRYRDVPATASDGPTRVELRNIKLLVVLAALHHAAYGVAYSQLYGVGGTSGIVDAVTNPGGAYLAKFGTIEALAASNHSSAAGQALTLTAVLSAPLLPFLVVYWGRLTKDLKIISILGLCVYISFFLAIGTLVGLGNVLIFAVAGLLVRKVQTETRSELQGMGKKARGAAMVAVLLGLVFASYMAFNQGSRAESTGADKKFDPNPVVAKFASEEFARGVSVMVFYPTHGYEGLAHNLGTPFEWTGGRGASRAVESYVTQYGLGDSVADKTYPARTEERTGWPAGTNWSTIYPWLASDLTFPGAVLFMGVVGWWLARWWFEAVAQGAKISMLLFAQMLLLIAFVPANHQLGLSRSNLVTFAVLVAVYLLTARPTRTADASRTTVRGSRATPAPPMRTFVQPLTVRARPPELVTPRTTAGGRLDAGPGAGQPAQPDDSPPSPVSASG